MEEPLDFLRDFRLRQLSLVPEPVSILLLWRGASPIANSGVGLDWGGAARNRIAIGPQPLRGEWLSDFDKKRGLWLETRQFRKRDTPDPFSARCEVKVGSTAPWC